MFLPTILPAFSSRECAQLTLQRVVLWIFGGGWLEKLVIKDWDPNNPDMPEEALSHLRHLAGQDAVLEAMLSSGEPLTRDTYLELAYPDNLPDDWGPELEGELPPPFQWGYDLEDAVTEDPPWLAKIKSSQKVFDALGLKLVSEIKGEMSPFKRLDLINEHLVVLLDELDLLSGAAQLNTAQRARLEALNILREETKENPGYFMDGPEAWAYMNGIKAGQRKAREALVNRGWSQEDIDELLSGSNAQD